MKKELQHWEGGSDTSAVALAAVFGAERCDIFTDVEGIFTTDPRIVNGAKKLDRIAYEEMLELSSMEQKFYIQDR